MIKKYITLAALLTAGTALANAATWEKTGEELKITTTFSNTTVSDISQVNTNVSVTSNWNRPYTAGSSSTTSTHSLWNSGASKDSSIVPYIDLSSGDTWTLDIDYSLGAINNSLLGSYFGSNVKLRLDSVEITLGAIQTKNGDWVASPGGNHFKLTSKFTDSSNQTLDGGARHLPNQWISGGSQDYLINGDGPQASPLTITYYGYSDAHSNLLLPNQLGFSFVATKGDNTSADLKSLGIQSIVFNTSVVKQVNDTPVTPPSSPSVPEPSAFGLLAGLGALALVSARRRRK